ncbi:phage baseplate assembly protein V [Pseudodesulfovibrio sp. JC047]|nr:phage baseplate assembly protein V [Pseudodesulfovibrio sp. JC047]
MRALEKMLRPIRRRLTLMVSRAVLVMIDDDTTLQELQTRILGEELLDSLERFQQYGFTSVPHQGAEAITLSVGGHRSHTVVINVDDRRYRLKGLQGGEVALYTDEDTNEGGCRIVLKRNNIIQMRARELDLEGSERVRIASLGELELHAGTRRETDVAGYGEALIFKNGTWHTDTYHEGSTFVAGTERGIQPPEVD